jgi:hypothetical protein
MRAAARVWRDNYFLRNFAPMSVAWAGLVYMSVGTAPWSGKDLAWLAVLLFCALWRG